MPQNASPRRGFKFKRSIIWAISIVLVIVSAFLLREFIRTDRAILHRRVGLIVASNHQISDLLGSPVEEVSLPGEPINDFISDKGGVYTIRLQGAREKALLQVSATRNKGNWDIKSIHLILARTGERIELQKLSSQPAA